MNISYLASQLIHKYGVYSLSTFLFDLKVLLLFLNNKKPNEIAEELNLSKKPSKSGVERLARSLWIQFATKESKDSQDGLICLALFQKESEYWIEICNELITQLSAIGITVDKELNEIHRNIDLMEFFLGNFKGKINISGVFGRSNATIETIQKRVFYYVIQQAPEKQREYLDRAGDGDWYYSIFQRNRYYIQGDERFNAIADVWEKEYKAYKKRHGYTSEPFKKFCEFFLSVDKENQIQQSIQFLEQNGYLVTKIDISK